MSLKITDILAQAFDGKSFAACIVENIVGLAFVNVDEGAVDNVQTSNIVIYVLSLFSLHCSHQACFDFCAKIWKIRPVRTQGSPIYQNFNIWQTCKLGRQAPVLLLADIMLMPFPIAMPPPPSPFNAPDNRTGVGDVNVALYSISCSITFISVIKKLVANTQLFAWSIKSIIVYL